MAGAFGSIMSGLGGLVSGASALFGSSGGVSTYKSSKLARIHNKYQEQYDKWYLNKITKPTAQWALRNQFSLQRQGLIKAGYNPMLGYMSSSNAPITSASGVSTAVANEDNSAMAGIQGAQALGSLAQVNSQISNTNANTALQEEQAKTEQAKRVQMDFQNAMYDVEKHLKEKDLSTYERRFYTDMYERMQRAENYRAQTNVTAFNAQTARMNAESSQRDSMVNALWRPYDSKTKRYEQRANAKRRSAEVRGLGFGISGSGVFGKY